MSHLRIRWIALTLLLSLLAAASQDEKKAPYYPEKGDAWQTRKPGEVGIDGKKLEAALEVLKKKETRYPRELGKVFVQLKIVKDPKDLLGPIKDRGGINGIVLKDGYIVAEFGDTKRVDMVFSVSKSFLSTVAGLAWDDGALGEVTDPVRKKLPIEQFSSEHNGRITWEHLLQQRSEWDGSLWGIKDSEDYMHRTQRSATNRKEPGEYYEYNDIRVNLLAYSLLKLLEKPLPKVLKERVMDPIGASDTWQWHGYKNSKVDIKGEQIESVSGGGHWGGGVWMSTRDLARWGYLYMRGGKWKDKQILSKKWIKMATTPSPIKKTYAYMWWLTPRPSNARKSFAALGMGSNVVWIDPEHNLVVVVRWLNGSRPMATFAKALVNSLKKEY